MNYKNKMNKMENMVFFSDGSCKPNPDPVEQDIIHQTSTLKARWNGLIMIQQ